MKRGWEAHEKELQELFGLRSTIASGNKWFDQGDGVTPGRGGVFPLYVDGKYTEGSGYRVTKKEMEKYEEQASNIGKRLVLALRFWAKTDHFPQDYAVISLHDLKELIDMATKAQGDKWVM